MRLVHTGYDATAGKTKIYRDPSQNEYVVKFFRNGLYLDAADYYTDHKDDAIGTSRHFHDENINRQRNIK